VDISWSFNGAPVANTSLTTIYEERFFKGGIPFQQSLLRICGVLPTQAGAYTCTATNGQSIATAITELIVFG
jgi:hypothetical protein